MKKIFLALSCALWLAGCATDNSVDYSSEMDAYSPSNYDTDNAYNYSLPSSTYRSNVYIPTAKAKNKAKVQLPSLTAPKTVRALPSLSTPAKAKTPVVKATPQPAVAKKAAKPLPVLDSGTLSKLKTKPVATPIKAVKKPAQCPVKTVVKYKYITKYVTKKPVQKPVQKTKKTVKPKAKKK
jgi:hypothetical protein